LVQITDKEADMSWWKRVIERVERAAMASTYAQVGETELARKMMRDGSAEDESEN
jgi:hypothetical protein